MNKSILLVKPPFFSPLTPPLGIAILKSYLEQNGCSVRCIDLNVDPELWGAHHKYFKVLQELEKVSINDGYSKLWWILNAHLLARANGARPEVCARVMRQVIPFYGVSCDEKIVERLHEIVERFFRRLESTVNALDLSAYSIVGSSTYTTSLAASLFFLKLVKTRRPEIVTVMGGGVFADDLALGSENLQTLIDEYPYIDHVILGEGELLFLRLVQGELSDRRVISMTDLKAEKLQIGEVPSPDFSDFDLTQYYHLTIEGARSCPFQCSFCSETIQWGQYRKKSMAAFTDHVVQLAERYGNPSFFMGDSLMNPYIADFSTELLKRNAGIAFDGYLRADKPVANRARVQAWAKSGLYRVRLGIESASARILGLMDKMTSPKVIADVFKSLAGAGVRPTTYWIVGFPGETEEDFQETLEFIRENHPYIYELEAHPYYYYPYGQIGSRLYQCDSLYPDEVTEVIKFKVWDIRDGSPTREERYERLRRISRLASELGLPNIYTMEERYQAETRWHALHPLAAEVYEGVSLFRPRPSLPDHPTPAPKPFGGLGERMKDEPAILGYHITVASKPDEELVRRSLALLAANCEMLQLSLDLEQGALTPARESLDCDPLVLVESLEAEDIFKAARIERQVKETLAAEMTPAGPGAVRGALSHDPTGSSDLFLFARRELLDGRSLTLLCEDLYRIYRQLENDRPISLRPPARSYCEWISELDNDSFWAPDEPAAEQAASDPSLSAECAGPLGVKTVLLPKKLQQTLFGQFKARQIKAADLFLVCALRALRESIPWKDIEIDVADDYRGREDALSLTVGRMIRRRRLNASAAGAGGLLEQLKYVEQTMEASGSGAEKPAASEAAHAHRLNRILANLECLTPEPWLGGDAWTPREFLFFQAPAESAYPWAITPAASGKGLYLHVFHQPGAEGAEIAAKIISRLAEELEAALQALDETESTLLPEEATIVAELEESFSFSF